MRPQSLFPLFAKIDRLPGIGPRTLALIAKVAGERPLDLLWHRPTGLIDRRATGSTAAAEPGQIATLVVEVVEHRPGGGARAPYKIECRDDGGEIDLVYFNAKSDWLWKTFPPHQRVAVAGLAAGEDDLPGVQLLPPPAQLGLDLILARSRAVFDNQRGRQPLTFSQRRVFFGLLMAGLN